MADSGGIRAARFRFRYPGGRIPRLRPKRGPWAGMSSRRAYTMPARDPRLHGPPMRPLPVAFPAPRPMCLPWHPTQGTSGADILTPPWHVCIKRPAE